MKRGVGSTRRKHLLWRQKMRERKHAWWAQLYATAPETANCYCRSMRPKREFASWSDAFIACLQLRNIDPTLEMRFPYRCRMGHIHIGKLPTPARMLTGGVEIPLHP